MPTKRADGRLQTSIRITNPLTGERKKVYVYGYTEEELKREVARIKRDNGIEVIAPTFGEWKDEWLKIKSEEVTQATINSYKDSLRLSLIHI